MGTVSPVTMRGVRIIRRNFKGEASKYNAEGTRNFGVILPSMELAEAMTVDDWNVKWLEPREEDEERVPWLPVEAAFHKGRPPRIVMITSRGATDLKESTVELLDGVDILNVDLIVNPSVWSGSDGKGGVKAYLKTMMITVEEDELEQEYANMLMERQ